MDRVIVRECKERINVGDKEGLREIYEAIQHAEFDYRLSWEYIFIQVYTHACLRKQEEIARWIWDTIYPTLDPVAKLATRQAVSYGNYLLRR